MRLGVAIDLLEADGVPRERLTRLAGEQFRIVASDQRSFALLAARFPEPPAGEMLLSLARGELRALRLLADFAAALEWQERDLQAYEPQPPESGVPATVLARWQGRSVSMAAVMIGTGPHKASHTAVAISAAQEPLSELRVRACAGRREEDLHTICTRSASVLHTRELRC